MNEDGGNDGRCRPVACAWRHLEEPLLQRELANLSHASVATSQKRSHDPRHELKEREEGAVEVLQKFGGLKDAIDGTQDALAQDGRAESRVVMMIFVRDRDRREDGDGHGRAGVRVSWVRCF